MTKRKTADKRSKQDKVKRVATSKRRYFVPSVGREVEVETLDRVQDALNATKGENDGNR